MDFDEIIDWRGTGSSKWDGMEKATGVSAPDALAMWVADMDFRAPDFLRDAVAARNAKGHFGYFVGESEYRRTVADWMRRRHGWDARPEWINSTYGLGNGIAVCLQAFTDPGDEVIIFTPVYHEFANKIRNAGRTPRECPLAIRDGVYVMDLEGYEANMSGRERAVLFCSPHNPAGRVWSVEEQVALAEFCERHDLLMMSDEIHHDLVFPGHRHVPMAIAAPDIQDRLIMLTSASKSFNIAGTRLGAVTIPSDDLRARFEKVLVGLNIQPNLFGMELTMASYSDSGAAWLDQLVAYLAQSCETFIDGVNTIPGVTAMPMQATYLAWVDFADTGMDMTEARKRVLQDARIAPSNGRDFGTGGETCLRFNLATPRANVEEAVSRLQFAFSDLQ